MTAFNARGHPWPAPRDTAAVAVGLTGPVPAAGDTFWLRALADATMAAATAARDSDEGRRHASVRGQVAAAERRRDRAAAAIAECDARRRKLELDAPPDLANRLRADDAERASAEAERTAAEADLAALRDVAADARAAFDKTVYGFAAAYAADASRRIAGDESAARAELAAGVARAVGRLAPLLARVAAAAAPEAVTVHNQVRADVWRATRD